MMTPDSSVVAEISRNFPTEKTDTLLSRLTLVRRAATTGRLRFVRTSSSGWHLYCAVCSVMVLHVGLWSRKWGFNSPQTAFVRHIV